MCCAQTIPCRIIPVSSGFHIVDTVYPCTASRASAVRYSYIWGTRSCLRGSSEIVLRPVRIGLDVPGPFLFVLFSASFRLVSSFYGIREKLSPGFQIGARQSFYTSLLEQIFRIPEQVPQFVLTAFASACAASQPTFWRNAGSYREVRSSQLEVMQVSCQLEQCFIGFDIKPQHTGIRIL